MIPQDHSQPVARALHQAFGVTQFEDIRDLTNGPNSNLAYRIVVRGSPFLLRINTRRGDPARNYACMQAAAEAGLAPRVWYTSAEDRISITDFVNAKPFPAAEALVRIPAVLRSVHALPPFPGVPHQINTTCMFLMHEGPALDAFVQRIQAANLLPKSDTDEIFAWHAQLAAACPHRDADMVSSHNDLFKPDNMLFDGQRLWLVDWEAGFLNDRYADLAVAANQVVANDADESIFLHHYFGAPPDVLRLGLSSDRFRRPADRLD
jgi:thiamine kinase-like enzyme